MTRCLVVNHTQSTVYFGGFNILIDTYFTPNHWIVEPPCTLDDLLEMYNTM